MIPAGGAGTRLWPLSRAASPKFLLDLVGSGRSLLQATVDRLAPVAGDRILVVTGAAHRDAVAAQLPELPSGSVVAEPSPRDSMAAIGLAAAMLEARDPRAVMGSFAADHVIGDAQGFREAVAVAVEVARHDLLVTIGIEPTWASSAFGYIHAGAPLDGLTGALAVEAFVEKPSPEVAAQYVQAGTHRWNAGMFVARCGVLLDLLAAGDPDFAAALRAIAADPSTLESVWPTLPRIAFDYAVAEPAAAAGRVAVVPASFGWDDVGDFDALGEIVDRPGEVAVLSPGATASDVAPESLVVVEGATGLVAPGSGRVVAVVGLDDVVVIDTPDAVLVTTRERAQDVKQIVARLRERGRDDVL